MARADPSPSEPLPSEPSAEPESPLLEPPFSSVEPVSPNQHLKVAFVSLGYAKAATLNSLVTGLGVEVSCNYLFVYRLRLGAAGAAYAKLALSASRLAG